MDLQGRRLHSKAPEPISFAITDIDLEGRRRSSVPEGSSKPGALKIVRAINANHFLEVVNEGFLNLTTVYDKDPTSGSYPAVHSRHFGVLGPAGRRAVCRHVHGEVALASCGCRAVCDSPRAPRRRSILTRSS